MSYREVLILCLLYAHRHKTKTELEATFSGLTAGSKYRIEVQTAHEDVLSSSSSNTFYTCKLLKIVYIQRTLDL